MPHKSSISVADVTIIDFRVIDLRFPTSLDGVGSDDMHTFSNGRGSEVICLCLDIFAERVIGKSMADLNANMGKTWRYMVSDSQYRWIGPDESVTHLAAAGVPNAILKKAQVGKEERVQDALRNRAVPAYSTSQGGPLMRAMLSSNSKVGTDLEADCARLAAVRDILGYDNGYHIMIDANQFKPVYIEEQTNPDDVLGHESIQKALKLYGVGVATGEAVQNWVTFKQLLQAEATDVAQIEAVRLGSVNECLAVMVMAKAFGVPCAPQNGAIRLTELTSHLSLIDYIVVSGQRNTLEFAENKRNKKYLKYAAEVKDAHYVTPMQPGYRIGYNKGCVENFEFPGGEVWRSEEGKRMTGGDKIPKL
ncbi:enolase C-terminal domain-like protein [Zopfia rhizophila CBS 207.26]|uniref:Enolase C-terminal domain-like protein n=1 Tax=Zopfia rhizophila CBS 207.26 TaxID=1314779 RepID=A0A6A6EHT7_9PEZI|nr:enolase C-terminal domain-like protein [Zopfia rhizophila CBS 207.26]